MHRFVRRWSPRSMEAIALAAVVAMVVALLTAPSAFASATVHFVDGGTTAPAATLGGYPMTAFSPDARPTFNLVTDVPDPAGTITFGHTMTHYHATDLAGGWGNGYHGDIYAGPAHNSVTITLPADSDAFYLYALNSDFGTWDFTVTTDDGTSGGPIAVTTGGSAAHNFGFFADPGTTIASITVSSAHEVDGLEVGEFGIHRSVSSPVLSIGNTVHTVGVDTTTTLSSADGSTPTTITCACSALPSGMSFTSNGSGTPGTAQISGSPALGTGGNYTVTVTATATDGGVATQPVTITVHEGPQFTNASVIFVHVGLGFSYPISTSPAFPPGTTVSCSCAGLPAGVTFTPSGAGGTLAGTPTVFGQFTVTFTATNGIAALNATQVFTLNVDAPPVFDGTPLAHTWLVGTYSSYTITTTPGFPAATAIVLTGGVPSGLSYNDNHDGTATISGTADDVVGAGGVYTRTITASNAGLAPNSDVKTLTITVKQAPFFGGSTLATFTANQANTSGAITTSGGYPLPRHLSVLTPTPSWLTFHPGSGTFTGTPPVSASGDYYFNVQACNSDNSVCRVETYEIDVQAPVVVLPTAAPVSDGAISGVQAITTQGSCVSWHASGFAPFAPVTLAAYKVPGYSGKANLGTFNANLGGDVDLFTCLPSGLLGAKYIVAGGYQTSGAIAYLTAQTTIKAPVHFGH